MFEVSAYVTSYAAVYVFKFKLNIKCTNFIVLFFISRSYCHEDTNYLTIKMYPF